MAEYTDPEVETLTVRIPTRLECRGGRKLIITPEGVRPATPEPRRDDTSI